MHHPVIVAMAFVPGAEWTIRWHLVHVHGYSMGVGVVKSGLDGVCRRGSSLVVGRVGVVGVSSMMGRGIVPPVVVAWWLIHGHGLRVVWVVMTMMGGNRVLGSVMH
jgi:hypothetical protein